MTTGYTCTIADFELRNAVMRNDVSGVENLLTHHDTDPNIPLPSGWAAFHYACSRKNVDLIKPLLSYKANINCKSIDGETPLCALIICCTD